MKRVVPVAALALAAIMSVGAARAQPVPIPTGEPPEDLVQPDPNVLLGRLPNGMRYAITSTTGLPEMTIDFYVGAGSLDETNAERGTAHFLEHMAFSGSKSFPPGTLLPKFEEIGVGLGRDQNAQTGLAGTTFSLDIADASDDKVDMAFTWLRDVADGLSIEPAEVDRERGTILSEYRESLNPSTDVATKMGDFLFGELRGSHRLPIGTLETIRAANAASIRAFYERWYRPEDTIMVVVSDRPAYEVRARIEKTFGSWRDATPATPKPPGGHVNAARGLSADVVVNADAANHLQVCRVMDKDPVIVEGVRVHVRDLEDQAWTSVLTKRLARLSESPNPPIAAGEASRSDVFETGSASCIDLGVRDRNWRAALKAAAVEVRRLDLYGITPAEMTATRDQIRAGLEAGLAGGNSMTQKARADLILANFLLGGTIDSVEEDHRVLSKALDQIDPEKTLAEFHRVWSKANGPLLVLVSPTAVAPAELSNAWREAMSGPPPARPVDRPTNAWAYTDFGPPGAVASREPIDNLDATRITFANGVRVNYKFVSNMPDKVFVRIRFGAGQEELPPGAGFAGELGALLLRSGGLGKNDFHDTVGLCETHVCDVRMTVARDSFVLDGATRVSDLDVQLQLLTAFLTDPGFRPEVDAQLPTATSFAFRQLRVDPGSVANEALQNALPRPHVADLPTETEAAKINSAEFRRLLQRPLTSDALEVTVVGDIDEATLTTALAKTLGAIPARAVADHVRPDAPHVRFAETAPPTLHATHDGPTDKAAVVLTWPLFVWTPERLREDRTLQVLSGMLQDALIDTVRRKLGKTYSPAVQVSLPRGGDQGNLNVELITAPGDVDAVVAETRRIVADFAAGQLTAEALERTRRPIIDDAQSREVTVGWWMDTLDQSAAHPDKIAAAQSWQTDFSSITLDEVKAAAKRWLSQTPMIAIATPKRGG